MVVQFLNVLTAISEFPNFRKLCFSANGDSVGQNLAAFMGNQPDTSIDRVVGLFYHEKQDYDQENHEYENFGSVGHYLQVSIVCYEKIYLYHAFVINDAKSCFYSRRC